MNAAFKIITAFFVVVILCFSSSVSAIPLSQFELEDGALMSCIKQRADSNGYTDTEEIYVLSCWDYEIKSISGMQQLNNLRYLDLRGSNNIDDYSPIAEMPYLKELYLSATSQEQFNSICAMNNYTTLYVGSDIQDFSPVLQLDSLAHFSTSSLIRDGDLSLFAQLPALESLFLKWVDLGVDLSPIKDMNLDQLSIWNRPISSLDFLGGSHEWRFLDLHHLTAEADISVLTEFDDLFWLKLAGDLSAIDSDFLSHFPKLEVIDLGNYSDNSALSSISSLFDLSGLYSAGFSGFDQVPCAEFEALDSLVSSRGKVTWDKASCKDSINYVALGDSFSSGEGAEHYVPGTDEEGVNECRRSEAAYTTAHPGCSIAEEQKGKCGSAPIAIPSSMETVVRHSFACSGATTTDVAFFCSTDEGASSDCLHAAPDNMAQIDHPELTVADMVTLSIGGNDVGFTPIALDCLFKWNCPERQFLYTGIKNKDYFAQKARELDLTTLPYVLSKIKEKSAYKPIFVLGYPYLLPIDLQQPCGSEVYGIAKDEREFMREAVDRVNTALECSAMKAGVHFIPVVDNPVTGARVPNGLSFEGFEACSSGEDWINEAQWLKDSHESFHPNKRGHQQYAKIVNAYLGLKDAVYGVGAIPHNPQPVTDPEALPSYCEPINASRDPRSIAPTVSTGKLVMNSAEPACLETNYFVPDQVVNISGAGYMPESDVMVEVRFIEEEGISLGSFTANQQGEFAGSIVIPKTAPVTGLGRLSATGSSGSGGNRWLSNVFKVVLSLTADLDSDGIPDVCDNCPQLATEIVVDQDSDGLGDACDPFPNDSENDWDGDGLGSNEDECQFDALNDADGDGLCADLDNCPDVYNPDQEDVNYNGVGNQCEQDWAAQPITVTSGFRHSVAILENGELVSWGNNDTSQLSDGTLPEIMWYLGMPYSVFNPVDRLSPVPVVDGSGNQVKNVGSVTAGSQYTIALKEDGTMLAWGYGGYGALGGGTFYETKYSPVPVVYSDGTIVEDIELVVSSGHYHNLALKSDGTMLAWGLNERGQLGDGSTVNRASPVVVTTSSGDPARGVKAVSAGQTHNLALTEDGEVLSWGANWNGYLVGESYADPQPHPVPVKLENGNLINDAKAIAAGSDFSLVLRKNGTILTWGWIVSEPDLDDQDSSVSRTGYLYPIPVSYSNGDIVDNIVAIAASNSSALALKGNGTVIGWGGNDNGELGDGSYWDRIYPVPVIDAEGELVRGVVEIGFNGRHAVIKKIDGSIWSWGPNDSGQLGDGTTVAKNYAVKVNDPVSVSSNIFEICSTEAVDADQLFLDSANAEIISSEVSIITSGLMTINSGESRLFKANTVRLRPGFAAVKGSSFGAISEVVTCAK